MHVCVRVCACVGVVVALTASALRPTDVLQLILSCQVFDLALPETHRACFVSVEACPVPTSSQVAELTRQSVERRRQTQRRHRHSARVTAGATALLQTSTAAANPQARSRSGHLPRMGVPLRADSAPALPISESGPTSAPPAVPDLGMAALEVDSTHERDHSTSSSSGGGHRTRLVSSSLAASAGGDGGAGAVGAVKGDAAPATSPPRRSRHRDYGSTATSPRLVGVHSAYSASSLVGSRTHASGGAAAQRVSPRAASGPLPRPKGLVIDTDAANDSPVETRRDVVASVSNTFQLVGRTEVVTVSGRSSDSNQPHAGDMTVGLDGSRVNAAFSLLPQVECPLDVKRGRVWSRVIKHRDAGLGLPSAIRLASFPSSGVDSPATASAVSVSGPGQGTTGATSPASAATSATSASAAGARSPGATIAALASGMGAAATGTDAAPKLAPLGASLARSSSGGRLSTLGTAASVKQHIRMPEGGAQRLLPPRVRRHGSYGSGWDSVSPAAARATGSTAAAATATGDDGDASALSSAHGDTDDDASQPSIASVARSAARAVAAKAAQRGASAVSEASSGDDGDSGKDSEGAGQAADVFVSEDGSHVFVGGVCSRNMILRFNCYASMDAVAADTLDASHQLEQPRSHPVFQESLLCALFPDQVGHDAGVVFNDTFAAPASTTPDGSAATGAGTTAGATPAGAALRTSHSAAGPHSHGGSGGGTAGRRRRSFDNEGYAQHRGAGGGVGGDGGEHRHVGLGGRSISTNAARLTATRHRHEADGATAGSPLFLSSDHAGHAGFSAHRRTGSTEAQQLEAAAARRRHAHKWKAQQVWVGQAVCVASTLMRSESAQVELPLLREDGMLVGWLRVRLAALKKGKPASTRRRLSKWYGFRDTFGGRLLVEEDLRESVYAFSVPAKLLSLIVEERRANVLVAQRDLLQYRALVHGRGQRKGDARQRPCDTTRTGGLLGEAEAKAGAASDDSGGNGNGNGNGNGGIGSGCSYGGTSTDDGAAPAAADDGTSTAGVMSAFAASTTGTAGHTAYSSDDGAGTAGDGSDVESGLAALSSSRRRRLGVGPRRNDQLTLGGRSVMGTVGMFGTLVGYLREAEESKRAMRWLEDRVLALQEYVEVLERCVGIGRGGHGHNGATFKASTQKKDQELRFVATNLHLQEMRVRELAGSQRVAVHVHSGGTGQMSFATGLLLGRHNRSVATEVIYSNVTVGAFAAHVYGFKHGGIRQLRDYVAAESDNPRDWGASTRSLNSARTAGVGGAAGATGSAGGAGGGGGGGSGGAKRSSPSHTSFLSANQRRRAVEDAVLHIQMREDAVLCQAASALVTAFARQMRLIQQYMVPVDAARLLRQYNACGFLVCVESLLSTIGKELGMLGDFDAGVKMLSRFAFRLLPPRERAPVGVPHHQRHQRASHTRGGGQVRIARAGELYVIELRLWPVPEPRGSRRRHRRGYSGDGGGPARGRSTSAPMPPRMPVRRGVRPAHRGAAGTGGGGGGGIAGGGGGAPTAAATRHVAMEDSKDNTLAVAADGTVLPAGAVVVNPAGTLDGSQPGGAASAGVDVDGPQDDGNDVEDGNVGNARVRTLTGSSDESDALDHSESSDTEDSDEAPAPSAIAEDDEPLDDALAGAAGAGGDSDSAAGSVPSPAPRPWSSRHHEERSATSLTAQLSQSLPRSASLRSQGLHGSARSREPEPAAVEGSGAGTGAAVGGRAAKRDRRFPPPLSRDFSSNRSLDGAFTTPLPRGPSSWPPALREVLPDDVMRGGLIRVVPVLVTQVCGCVCLWL